MKILIIVLVVLLVAGLMFGGKYVGIRNELVTSKESVAAAWAQVDVALQRRSDLEIRKWSHRLQSGGCGCFD